jgi:choline dehydrogenase-like flavoprotein
VADALKSGNCTLMPNAVVSHVDMDAGANTARGVTYIDRESRKSVEIRGKSVILCAQALESTRILLNSATPNHLDGLGNSSGALGHYLMDHCVGGGASGELPGMVNGLPTMNAGNRPNGIYVIRFRNVQGGPKHPRFIRGYGYQGGSGAGFHYNAPGFGAAYKERVKEGMDYISLGAFGESLPRWDNYIEIDKNLRDAWGIPALRIHMTHGDNERALMEDAAGCGAEMLEAAGAKNIRLTTKLETPGMAIHELGTARMGRDPKKFVLNEWNQTHDVKNLFVMDGASFVSSACQNPTLSMMAIAVRACDHLTERFKKNEI